MIGFDELLKSAPAFMIFVGALVYVLKEVIPIILSRRQKSADNAPHDTRPVTRAMFCEAERHIASHAIGETKVLERISETLSEAAQINRDTSVMIKEHIADSRAWRKEADGRFEKLAIDHAVQSDRDQRRR